MLVVSDTRQNGGGDFVALPLSSRVRMDDKFGYVISPTAPFFAQSGLRCESTAKWTKPMTLSHLVIERRIGALPASVVDAIAALVCGMLAPVRGG